MKLAGLAPLPRVSRVLLSQLNNHIISWLEKEWDKQGKFWLQGTVTL